MNISLAPPTYDEESELQQTEEEPTEDGEESHLNLSGDVYAPPPPAPLSPGSQQSTPRRDMRSSASGITSNISALSETHLSETRTEGSEDGEKKKNKVSKVRSS